jgi:hypothetical protein
MATNALENDTRAPSDIRRLGAIAAATPITMYLVWNVISGWGGTRIEFIRATAVLLVIAIAAGWIVGGRSGRSIRSALLDCLAYAAVAWLITLPIGVIGSTWAGVSDGTFADPIAALGSMGPLLLYGLVSSFYVIPLLTPFGAGWSLTYHLLRRGMGV